MIADIEPGAWYSVLTTAGVAGWTFFDLRGGVPACQDAGGARLLRVNEAGVVDAVPRDALSSRTVPGQKEGFLVTSSNRVSKGRETFAVERREQLLRLVNERG